MQIAEPGKLSNRREDFLRPATRPSLICLVGQETVVGRLAIQHLQQEDLRVSTFSMGTDLLQKLERVRPSLVIIETSMSRIRALELCRAIRHFESLNRVPVVLLAVSASDEERSLGLDSGADDYITESSSGREIVARVRAVLRRVARQDKGTRVPPLLPAIPHSFGGNLNPTMRIGDIEIDPSAMRISVRGDEILTTNLEFRLLYFLVHNQTQVFSRDQLLDAVWGTQYVELRSVDACVRRLRRKIEPDPLRPTYLKTVRGAGYCLRMDVR